MTQTIENNWLSIFLEELKYTQNVLIISPFISNNLVDHLLKNSKDKKVQVITRFNLNDFRTGVSSLSAIEKLINKNIEVKGIKNLHSKLYIFDSKSAIIGSANFTSGGFFNNYEFGIKSTEESVITNSIQYFNNLWSFSKDSLIIDEVNSWQAELKSLEPTQKQESLPDYGISASIIGSQKRKYFIKFFGKSDHREDFDFTSREEIERSHCHWALTFSKPKGRPRRYNDGDIVYMARLLEGREYGIFGKATALRHVDSRDIASDEDIAHIDWKEDWPVYIRVKDPSFIDGSMADCPKMSELIDQLQFESFASTLNSHNWGKENINPWRSLSQQPDIQITEIAAEWLDQKFNDAISINGKVDKSFLKNLYQGSK